MTSLVVDSSLVVRALTEAADDQVLRRRLSEPRVLNAPHLVDFEVANALRGLALGGKIAPDLAEAAWRDFADLKIIRFPGSALGSRMWELRNNFTAYDAAYIVLAELLDCPLLSGDAKLQGKHRANVEVYPAG